MRRLKKGTRGLLAILVSAMLFAVTGMGVATAATTAAVADLANITFEPLAPSCGTTFNVRATSDAATLQEVTVVLQGDNNNAQAKTVPIQPGSHDLSFTFVPNGDSQYDIEIRDVSATVLFTWSMQVECTQPGALLYCYEGDLYLYGLAEAYNDTVVRTYEVKMNGTTIYGPVDTVPGDVISFNTLVTGFAPGTNYVLDNYIDDRLIDNIRIGEPTGSVPSCLPPVVKVSISGKVIVDNTIRCNASATSANPGGVFINRGWLFNGQPREGVNGSTLKITKSMYGQIITCTASAEDDWGNFAYTKSAGYKVGLGVAPVAKIKPSLMGTAKVGYTMKLKSVGSWSPKPTTYKCQVLVKTSTGKIIARTAIKTSSTCAYKLTRADRGKRLVIKVFAVLPYHVTGKALTAYSAVIK